MTTIIISAGSIYFLGKGGNFDLASEEISVRIATLVYGAIWLLVIVLISYVQANKVIYKNEKHEEIQENGELIAFTVKIENCKNDTYYFSLLN